ncbi:MAG: hypothetical protein ABIQ18_15650 [Umezawaea sp.]
MRQRVQERQVRLFGMAGFGFVRDVELGDSGQGGGLLGIQFVVTAAERLGERIVRVTVLSLP